MHSIIKFTGDGSTVRFPLTFTLGYLRQTYVSCRVDDEVDASGEPVYRSITWDDNDPNWVTIDGDAPVEGADVVFQRTVPKEELLYDFQRGAHLGSVALNESHEQLMMAIHEMLDLELTLEEALEILQDTKDFSEEAHASAISAAAAAAAAFNELATAIVEADRAAAEADRAKQIADGTIHPSRVFNVRASWEVQEDQASGFTMTLPDSYFPTRNHMLLFYNGLLCEVASATADTEFQYTEIGTVDELSSTVLLNFPIAAGDRFDMVAVASGVLQDLDTLKQTLTEAIAFAATLQEAQLTGLTHFFTGTFMEQDGLWYPVQPSTGRVMTMYGMCNGDIYPGIQGGLVRSPDLRGRFVLACDTDEIGETGGSETATSTSVNAGVSIAGHALTIAQMPAHTHTYTYRSSTSAREAGGAHWIGTATASTGSTGGGETHTHAVSQTAHAHAVSTMSPYYKLAMIISL